MAPWPPRKYADIEEGVGCVSETCGGWKYWQYWAGCFLGGGGQNHFQLWLNRPEGIMEAVFLGCFASDFLGCLCQYPVNSRPKRALMRLGDQDTGFMLWNFDYGDKQQMQQIGSHNAHLNVILALYDLMISNGFDCWCASICRLRYVISNCGYSIPPRLYHDVPRFFVALGDHFPAGTYSGSIPLFLGWCIWIILATLNAMFPWKVPEPYAIVVVNYNDEPTISIVVKNRRLKVNTIYTKVTKGPFTLSAPLGLL